MMDQSRTVSELAVVLRIEKKTLQNRLSDVKNPNRNHPRYFTLGYKGEKLFPREWTAEWLQREIKISGISPKAKF